MLSATILQAATLYRRYQRQLFSNPEESLRHV